MTTECERNKGARVYEMRSITLLATRAAITGARKSNRARSHLVWERYAVKMPLGRLFLRTSTVNKSEYDNANYTGRILKTKYISSVHLFYSPYVS